MPKSSPAPRLVHKSLRVDPDVYDELVKYLKREDPYNDLPTEMRRLMLRRLQEAKVRVAEMDRQAA